jgi:hypothetical protein
VISEHTTKTHVASVLSKLGLRKRVQAVVLVYETARSVTLAAPAGLRWRKRPDEGALTCDRSCG